MTRENDKAFESLLIKHTECFRINLIGRFTLLYKSHSHLNSKNRTYHIHGEFEALSTAYNFEVSVYMSYDDKSSRDREYIRLVTAHRCEYALKISHSDYCNTVDGFTVFDPAIVVLDTQHETT